MNPGMFGLGRSRGITVVLAGDAAGLLYGLHELVRRGAAAFEGPDDLVWDLPVNEIRMLDHWDNMGSIRSWARSSAGYAGGSIFWSDGRVRDDLTRVGQYARLLGSVGINAVGAEQRQRARRGGAAAHRSRGRRGAAGRCVPAARHPGVPVGELRGADHRGRAVVGRPARPGGAGLVGVRGAPGLRGDPRLRRVRRQGRLRGAAGPVCVRARPRRRSEPAGPGARAVRWHRVLASVRLRPPPGLARPEDRPRPCCVRPLRAARRAVRRQRRACR